MRAVVSNDLPLLNASSLSYCTSNHSITNNISCYYETPHELNWPVESRSLSILTFAKDKLQASLSLSPDSDEFEGVNETQYFTLGPEHVLVKVDHAVVASRFGSGRGQLAASKRQMIGYLLDSRGALIRKLSVPGKPDKITLQELLEAGGMSGLDEPSDALNAKGQSIRQRGVVIIVSIYYQNWFNTWFGTR